MTRRAPVRGARQSSAARTSQPGRAPTRRAGSKPPRAPSRGRVTAPHAPAVPPLPFPLTNLDKVFFPRIGVTKGDLITYYAQVAPYIIPAIRDRPLALKRYPDGVSGPFFFQQNAPAAARVPRGVRVESVPVELDGAPHPRIVGGTLTTLLYTTQLGCIGVDPWHARIRTLRTPDYAIIDLDPGASVVFSRIVEVALWVRAALERAGLNGTAKTSGSRGIHIYIPLPPRTSDAVALAVAQRIATSVAEAHPREATVIRGLSGRGDGTVYVDYLQNARGKTVAAAYCVRAVEDALVSTPLLWSELTPGLDPRTFTLQTVPARLARTGDLWAVAMKQGNSASAIRALVGATEKRRRQ
jgi:bifunctional non-homologous end joining protein LigD